MYPCSNRRRYCRCVQLPQSSSTSVISKADRDERIPLFTRAVESDPELPYAPLLRYAPSAYLVYLLRLPRTLETQDDFVQLKAAQILTVLLWSVHVDVFDSYVIDRPQVPRLRFSNRPSYSRSWSFSPHSSKEALPTSVILQFNV